MDTGLARTGYDRIGIIGIIKKNITEQFERKSTGNRAE